MKNRMGLGAGVLLYAMATACGGAEAGSDETENDTASGEEALVVGRVNYVCHVQNAEDHRLGLSATKNLASRELERVPNGHAFTVLEDPERQGQPHKWFPFANRAGVSNWMWVEVKDDHYRGWFMAAHLCNQRPK